MPRGNKSLCGLIAVAAMGLALITSGRAATVGFPLVDSYPEAVIGTSAKSWVTVQAPSGELLFGLDSLASFDGERWTVSAMGKGYAVRGLDFEPHGARLWAGSNGEVGWFSSEAGKWVYHSLAPKLPGGAGELGEVWHAFADGEAGAVFVTDRKILRWNGAKFEQWSLPGTRRLWGARIGNRIYIYARTSCGAFAYGHAADESFSAACERSLIELSRHDAVVRTRWLASMSGDAPALNNRMEQRSLFFSTAEGHALFLEKANQAATKEPFPAEVLCDAEILGPWSDYATVWRFALRPPSLSFLRAPQYFFW